MVNKCNHIISSTIPDHVSFVSMATRCRSHTEYAFEQVYITQTHPIIKIKMIVKLTALCKNESNKVVLILVCSYIILYTHRVQRIEDVMMSKLNTLYISTTFTTLYIIC